MTVQPYPSTTGDMKAAMDGTGEIGYTADVGMTQLYAGEGGFKNYKAAKGKLVDLGTPTRWNPSWRSPPRGPQYKCWGT